jgi:UDP-glucose 4-epimerase
MKQTILVVGGAGYIGSHVVLDLRRQGYTPVVFDNLSTGNRDIAGRLDVAFTEGDLNNKEDIAKALQTHTPAAVMHFAAFAYVGESVTHPAKYYRNNVVNTLNLLEVMLEEGVKKLIFSSTCATYGIPKQVPISEETPQSPINPYGEGKLMVEKMLRDFDAAYGFRSVIFRYFNAAGADESGLIGERHSPETHLLPLAILAALQGTEVKIFGSDYPTPDGTCIRDYIHVSDISQAHIRGFEWLLKNDRSGVFNIGTGRGYSVQEVLQTVEKLTEKKVARKFEPRRAGDPPVLLAVADKLRKELGWAPRFESLEAIVQSAVAWHREELGV